MFSEAIAYLNYRLTVAENEEERILIRKMIKQWRGIIRTNNKKSDQVNDAIGAYNNADE